MCGNVGFNVSVMFLYIYKLDDCNETRELQRINNAYFIRYCKYDIFIKPTTNISVNG